MIPGFFSQNTTQNLATGIARNDIGETNTSFKPIVLGFRVDNVLMKELT